MKYRYSFSLFLLTIAATIALNLSVLHVAEASIEESKTPLAAKAPAAQETPPYSRPSLLAKFADTDIPILSLPQSSALKCKTDSPLFSSASEADLCGPTPSLTTSKDLKGNLVQKWSLPKSPEQFIWQKEVSNQEKMTVELIGSDMLPWPAKIESSRIKDKNTVQISPTMAIPADREMFLVGNIYDRNGKRIENWLVALTVKDNLATTVQ